MPLETVAAERPRFHPLKIADVRRETDDAVSIAFEMPADLAERFRYAPGQYLTLRTKLDGEEVRRSYSISSGLDDHEWRIAVKRVEGGLFSAFANERLAAGDTIDVMPPAGRFVLPEPTGPRTIVAFAAGSGITPVASQLRTVLVREPQSRVFLFYGNQTSRSILFREAIEDLKDRYMGRFSVHNVLSREAQDVAALNGRIDGEKVAGFMRHVVPVSTVDNFVLCGPATFLEGCTDALKALGVDAAKILLERFTPDGEAPRAPRARPSTEPDAAKATVAVTLDGVTTELKVGHDQRILDAAMDAGLDVPYSCRAGMCCTCRAKVTEGGVAMAVNYSLRPDEVDEGFVLTCQSTPTTDRVAVDYDAA
ncbi:1,2-phenylacetyl-CoA epoxidase subunit PaaE [Acuticoccus mangrovi]|uniref:Phenylacetate-CoA oxygenase/reductase subunit PaaK n=1 Tax=Acuticoccus mangrovi TaxID=2796142 RepID=A0A934IRA2_9HYPH|nr:1,2-phenylacetyl-CoA epoxidase subunit PaaE [Acuticoccus mangrovi]MBJ3776199.1 phenylacetate-CoA oxygenase/reductase subunit PaaK [Acuticoccus mangrovi]